MRLSPWRKTSIAILSIAIINMGMAGAASAAIVDTSALVTPDRAVDMSVVRTQLDRAEVRAKMEEMGVDAAAVDRRVASLNDRELHRLAVDMQNAPAGGRCGLDRRRGVHRADHPRADRRHRHLQEDLSDGEARSRDGCALRIPRSHAAVLLSACVTREPFIPADLPAGRASAVELDATPFFSQDKYQCGPAALATVLVASNVDTHS